MGIVYIAVLLATGIVFSYLHYPSKYQLNRSEGWMTYATIVSRGLFFLLLSLPVLLWIDTENYARIIADQYDLKYKTIKEWGYTFKEIKLFAWFFISFILSILVGLLIWVGYLFPSIRSWKTYRLSKQDALEHMLFKNTQQRGYIQDGEVSVLRFTLKSRKVYIGICSDLALEHGQVTEVQITPFFSGYNKPVKQKLVLTSNYIEQFYNDSDYMKSADKVYAKYQVLLVRSELETVSTFDLDSYEKMSSNKEKKENKSVDYKSFI